nr:hypothetical protein [Tanacetum cinerariifolium]
MEESSKQGSTWKDNKKAKTRSGYVATVPPRNDNVSTYPKCAKCYTFHLENAPCKLCYNCQKPCHYARQCWAPIRKVAPVNAVRMRQNQRACCELEALQDPKVMTGTFSLNSQFVTVLFDFRSDFSFISSKFVPLLNVEPCIVNLGYVIEIDDVESVKVDRVICDCKLELRNSLFTIDLIPLVYGSFDMIVGMDWLSKNKAVIVCHEKVVEIPIKEESVRDKIRLEYCLSSSYGWTKKSRSPVLWVEIREGSLIGPELVLEMTDKVVLIKEKLKAVRDHQNSYADKRCKPLEFEVGDRVLLRVSPWKGVVRFQKKGKLAPRYDEISSRKGYCDIRDLISFIAQGKGKYQMLDNFALSFTIFEHVIDCEEFTDVIMQIGPQITIKLIFLNHFQVGCCEVDGGGGESSGGVFGGGGGTGIVRSDGVDNRVGSVGTGCHTHKT